eukprot:TRINITY_DN93688_c0_g1_i1.p1 TRINITY_DN93688_c0_g1~~TRINITY_DN93688_c0_g1_i1.p1  ORF type:complete len:465 (-),score=76.71 TRINITY_DN93688_c0_g1_i1:147-1541(-)
MQDAGRRHSPERADGQIDDTEQLWQTPGPLSSRRMASEPKASREVERHAAAASQRVRSAADAMLAECRSALEAVISETPTLRDVIETDLRIWRSQLEGHVEQLTELVCSRIPPPSSPALADSPDVSPMASPSHDKEEVLEPASLPSPSCSESAALPGAWCDPDEIEKEVAELRRARRQIRSLFGSLVGGELPDTANCLSISDWHSEGAESPREAVQSKPQEGLADSQEAAEPSPNTQGAASPADAAAPVQRGAAEPSPVTPSAESSVGVAAELARPLQVSPFSLRSPMKLKEDPSQQLARALMSPSAPSTPGWLLPISRSAALLTGTREPQMSDAFREDAIWARSKASGISDSKREPKISKSKSQASWAASRWTSSETTQASPDPTHAWEFPAYARALKSRSGAQRPLALREVEPDLLTKTFQDESGTNSPAGLRGDGVALKAHRRAQEVMRIERGRSLGAIAR